MGVGRVAIELILGVFQSNQKSLSGIDRNITITLNFEKTEIDCRG